MHSKLRSPVAAAMLLLFPMTAALVATPASAQLRSVEAPRIGALTVNSDSGLAAGATLSFELDATPDARAAIVRLGGSDVAVTLRERRDGRYTGSYVVRRADRIDPRETMDVRLTHGDRTVTRAFSYPPSFLAAAPAARPFADRRDADRGERRETDRGERRDRDDRDDRRSARDQRPPQIEELSPANGDRVSERGRTRISARLIDQGSGIDPTSVRLRLAGRDVTGDARISDEGVQYSANLDPGRYQAEVRATDRAGNTTTKSWTFDVVGERPAAPPPVVQLPPVPTGPLTLAVTSHPNGAIVVDDGRLTLGGRTAPFTEVRVQVDTVSNAQGTVGVAQKVLDLVVRADANGNFEVPVTPSGFQLPGSRYEVRLSAARGNQVVTERLTLHRRQG